MRHERDLLLEGAAVLGLQLESQQVDRLLRYVDELEKWNRVHNLTAVRKREEMLSHHLLDSLAVAPHLPAGALCDVGTGPGLPGIPLAILEGGRAVSLVESIGKKTAFLMHAKAAVGLDNVSIHSLRVQDWQPTSLFPAVISRAFAELREFVASAAHLLAPGGKLLAMKGVFPADEIAALPAGFEVVEVARLSVPGLDAERHLIHIEAT